MELGVVADDDEPLCWRLFRAVLEGYFEGTVAGERQKVSGVLGDEGGGGGEESRGCEEGVLTVARRRE